MSQKVEIDRITKEVSDLIENIYYVADRLSIGNPDKVSLCEIAFSLRGMKGKISEMSDKLEIYKSHDDVLTKLVTTHTLVSLKDLENYNRILELFVNWNEKKVTDLEFAQNVVSLMGETYNKISHKMNEVEDENSDRY